MDDASRFSLNDCLNKMEKVFLHLARVPDETGYVNEFLEAMDEAKGLLADDAKEQENQDIAVAV